MFTISKIKWIGSLSLAGIVLLLASLGGNWGTDYTASANANLAPHIDYIDPQGVPSGSGDIVMIISGSNFGNMNDTAIRLTSAGYDVMHSPLFVSSTGISLNISHTLLAFPTTYDVTVYTSSKPSIPTLPIWPTYDTPSNTVHFIVYSPESSFLPIIAK
jgi:hypothetical protein